MTIEGTSEGQLGQDLCIWFYDGDGDATLKTIVHDLGIVVLIEEFCIGCRRRRPSLYLRFKYLTLSQRFWRVAESMSVDSSYACCISDRTVAFPVLLVLHLTELMVLSLVPWVSFVTLCLISLRTKLLTFVL